MVLAVASSESAKWGLPPEIVILNLEEEGFAMVARNIFTEYKIHLLIIGQRGIPHCSGLFIVSGQGHFRAFSQLAMETAIRQVWGTHAFEHEQAASAPPDVVGLPLPALVRRARADSCGVT